LSTEKVQSEKYLVWTEGKLVFRNDPIDVIARRIGRWYNVDVEIQGNNYTDIRLRATFVDENLEEVLYFIKRALPIDYKILTGGLLNDDDTYAKKKITFTTKNKRRY
jgi:ferric-dicitrate binding protein FerR (iron transport regulator)